MLHLLQQMHTISKSEQNPPETNARISVCAIHNGMHSSVFSKRAFVLKFTNDFAFITNITTAYINIYRQRKIGGKENLKK